MRKFESPIVNIYKEQAFVVEFPITGECNFKCDYCAYQYVMHQFQFFPNAVFDRFLNVLPTLVQIVPHKILINFTGGEPTLNLDLLQHFTHQLIPFLNEKVQLAMTTNGSYGVDIEAINIVNKLPLSFIKISLSAPHFAQQEIEGLINIAKNDIGNIYWLCNDRTVAGEKVKSLYKKLISFTKPENWIYFGIRETEQSLRVPFFIEDKSDNEPIIRRSGPDGIYLLPDGGFTPTCPGSGNQYTCKFDAIEELPKIASQLLDLEMNVTFKLKTHGKQIQSFFTPACLMLRKLNIPCTCLDTTNVHLFLKDNQICWTATPR